VLRRPAPSSRQMNVSDRRFRGRIKEQIRGLLRNQARTVSQCDAISANAAAQFGQS
jgi:hypothetical protein